MKAELTDMILERLRILNVPFKELTHAPVTTSADAAQVRGVDLSSGAKALLVKAGDNFSVFVIPGDRKLDWKAVKRELGNKSARFASSEEMMDVTGLVKGSLPPFGNLLGLNVYVDSDVLSQELIRFNAGSLTHSIEMPGNRILEAVDGTAGWYAS